MNSSQSPMPPMPPIPPTPPMRTRNVLYPFSSLLLATVALLLGTACTESSNPVSSPSPLLATRLAEGDRSAEDKARDAGRKPAAVVAFMGTRPGDTVVDVLTSGGYYTEVFAEAVGPDGIVYAHNIDFLLEMRDGQVDRQITARLANDRLPNVRRHDVEFSEPDLGLEPESVDLAFTALNVHDMIDGRGPEATQQVLQVLRGILKPDGVLGIVDHAGNPGDATTIATNKELHRIDEARVLEAIRAAGFELDATSDLLRNPADDRTKNVFAEGMRGQTDRFVLRFRKAD